MTKAETVEATDKAIKKVATAERTDRKMIEDLTARVEKLEAHVSHFLPAEGPAPQQPPEEAA